jgi:serine/threonine-protein kinase
MIGQQFGVYQVVSKLGEGGMGEVYRALDTRLKREVALKILPPSVAADHDRVARFGREAELLAALNHPNIAQIHGLEQAGGAMALVMEFVDGEDLAARITRGPIPIDEALPLASQMASALEAAHERGIVHRDLKPANVKVRPDGMVKVLDFGLAKSGAGGASGTTSTAGAVEDSPTITSPALTAAGVILGTAAYMSPEQARGKAVDRRTDIWAFGAVFFEMLTGQRPFAGDTVSDVIAGILARDPDWSLLPGRLSPTLRQYLTRCLDKDPKRRVRDIGDVLLALDGAFDAPTSTVAAAAPRRLLAQAMPIVITALAAAIVTGLVLRNRGQTPAPAAVSRFDVVLPPDQEIRGSQRSVIAVSPDGRAFAYMASDGLHLRSMGDLEPRLIPGAAEETRSQFARGAPFAAPFAAPFFSPDGQWIGYFTDSGLKKIGIAGGTPATIAASSSPTESYGMSSGASWSADGTILFGQPRGVMRVSANGGTPELIVPAGDGEQLWWPQMLPGGDAVLVTVVMSGTAAVSDGDVVVHSLSSGTRHILVRGGSDARYVPDGYLVYASQRSLMAVAFDARRLTTEGGAVLVAQNVQRPYGIAAGGVHYGVSDQGTLVYLEDNQPKRLLRWVNRDGTSGGSVEAVPAGALEDPRLSPDGGRVLVTRDDDIWIYDLSSGRSSRLTKNGRSLMGVWDPTGTQVAYSSRDGRVIEAWVAPADGSAEPRQLTHGGGLVHVDSWSPDGRVISVHRHGANGTIEILMIPVDRPDQGPVAFPVGGAPAESGCFARDGKYVAYVSLESGVREIYIRPYPGPGARVTVSAGGGVEPRWAPDGEVFYRNAAGDRMFSVPARTTPTLIVGKPTLLFEGGYYIAPTGSPRAQYDVTADGKRLLMLATTTTGPSGGRPRFIVVQNGLEELKQHAGGKGR